MRSSTDVSKNLQNSERDKIKCGVVRYDDDREIMSELRCSMCRRGRRAEHLGAKKLAVLVDASLRRMGV